MVTDGFGRRVDYLRISLTDRCNLRCAYCMPPSGLAWLPRSDTLRFEEIERFAALAATQGIRRIRLTGGEPLVRTGLVEHVARLRSRTGIEAIALTTNGLLLPRMAKDLAAAGLRRVNISLDTLDADAYAAITRGGRLSDALAGVEAALQAGMTPVKINVVALGGPQQNLLEFARLTVAQPLHVRFIEYMPIGGVGSGCHPADAWPGAPARAPTSDEVLADLTSAALAAGLGALAPVGPDEAPGGWGPARYFRLPGALGTIGIISPRSNHFCGACNRLRLTADGRLRACLWSDREVDVRAVLRTGSDGDVVDVIRAALAAKPQRHKMVAGVGTLRQMSQIGG